MSWMQEHGEGIIDPMQIALLPSLPPEIFAGVIDHLRHDKKSLLSTSVVCKSWVFPSQRHLFYSIHITGQHHPCSDTLRRFSGEITPALARLIRSFTIKHAPSVDIRSILVTLQVLPSVQLVSIVDCSIAIIGISDTMTFSLHPLSQLVLSNLTGSPRTFNTLLSNLPVLDSLSVFGCRVYNIPHGPFSYSVHPQTTRIKELAIKTRHTFVMRSSRANGPFFSALLSSMVSLTHLEIVPLLRDGLPEVLFFGCLSLIRERGRELIELRLDIGSPENERTFEEWDLARYCPSLQRLYFTIVYTNRIKLGLQDVTDLLCKAPLTIREVTIGMHTLHDHDPGIDAEAIDLTILDAVALGRLKNLELVQFGEGHPTRGMPLVPLPPGVKSFFVNSLPVTNARGILRFL